MPDELLGHTTLKEKIASNLLIIVAVLIAIALIGLLARSFHKAETESLRLKFVEEIDDKAELLEQQISLNFELLYTLKGLFDISQEVSYESFHIASQNILSRDNSIQGMSWEPWIRDSERDDFEKKYQSQFPGYEITQRQEQGVMKTSPRKETYTPVLYIEPWEGNQNAHGFDLSSHPSRLITLERARDTAELIATDSLVLVQDPSDVRSFLAIFALYKNPTTDIFSRREELHGYISGVFRINKLIERSIEKESSDGFDIRLLDVTNPKSQILYKNELSDKQSVKQSFFYEKALAEFGERKWLIQAAPSEEYIDAQRGSLPMAVFALGSLCVFLFGAYSSVLLNKTKELDKAKKIVEEISLIDGLTGIANRRHFDQYLEKEWARAIRDNIPISMMMLDIDYFKKFNDEFGHLAGDECLKRVAKALQRVINRRFDLLARFGGEEFVIVLHNTDQALPIAEACRKAVENCKINHPSSDVSKFVTISIGVCSMRPQPGADMNDFIDKADKALYSSKDNGCNRVTIEE